MGTSASAAAVIGSGSNANAQASVKKDTTVSIPAPSPSQLDRDVGVIKPPTSIKRAAQRPGSDLMVQILNHIGHILLAFDQQFFDQNNPF